MYPSRCASPAHFPMFLMAAQQLRPTHNCSASPSIPSPPSPSLPFHPPPDEIIIPKNSPRTDALGQHRSSRLVGCAGQNPAQSRQLVCPNCLPHHHEKNQTGRPANERPAHARFYTGSLPLRRPSRSDNASIRPFFFSPPPYCLSNSPMQGTQRTGVSKKAWHQ